MTTKTNNDKCNVLRIGLNRRSEVSENPIFGELAALTESESKRCS